MPRARARDLSAHLYTLPAVVNADKKLLLRKRERERAYWRLRRSSEHLDGRLIDANLTRCALRPAISIICVRNLRRRRLLVHRVVTAAMVAPARLARLFRPSACLEPPPTRSTLHIVAVECRRRRANSSRRLARDGRRRARRTRLLRPSRFAPSKVAPRFAAHFYAWPRGKTRQIAAVEAVDSSSWRRWLATLCALEDLMTQNR